MFPYGMAYDPTDDTVLVGDYWNFKVRRFSSSGDLLATYKNVANNGVGASYDVTIDQSDVPQSGLANYWAADQEQGYRLRVQMAPDAGRYKIARLDQVGS